MDHSLHCPASALHQDPVQRHSLPILHPWQHVDTAFSWLAMWQTHGVWPSLTSCDIFVTLPYSFFDILGAFLPFLVGTMSDMVLCLDHSRISSTMDCTLPSQGQLRGKIYLRAHFLTCWAHFLPFPYRNHGTYDGNDPYWDFFQHGLYFPLPRSICVIIPADFCLSFPYWQGSWIVKDPNPLILVPTVCLMLEKVWTWILGLPCLLYICNFHWFCLVFVPFYGSWAGETLQIHCKQSNLF